MAKDEILASLIMELRRGTIVLCVLHKLHTPMYGYNLVSELSDAGVPVEANTLYPLLRRLEGQGLLISSWELGESKPRKYYKTTPLGLEIESALNEQWKRTATSVQAIMEVNDHDE